MRVGAVSLRSEPAGPCSWALCQLCSRGWPSPPGLVAHVALSLCGFMRGCAGLLFIPGHRGHLRSRLPVAAASCCESSRCSPVASGVAVPGPLPRAGMCRVLMPVPVSAAALRFGAQSGLSLELCALDVGQSRACDSEPCQLLNQGNVSLHSVYGKRLPASPCPGSCGSEKTAPGRDRRNPQRCRPPGPALRGHLLCPVCAPQQLSWTRPWQCGPERTLGGLSVTPARPLRPETQPRRGPRAREGVNISLGKGMLPSQGFII